MCSGVAPTNRCGPCPSDVGSFLECCIGTLRLIQLPEGKCSFKKKEGSKSHSWQCDLFEIHNESACERHAWSHSALRVWFSPVSHQTTKMTRAFDLTWVASISAHNCAMFWGALVSFGRWWATILVQLQFHGKHANASNYRLLVIPLSDFRLVTSSFLCTIDGRPSKRGFPKNAVGPSPAPGQSKSHVLSNCKTFAFAPHLE